MGQSNLQKIQSSIIDLQEKKEITLDQSRQFFGDYISSGEKIKDINRFIEGQSIDLFLKYFINKKYPTSQRSVSQLNICKNKVRKSFYTEAQDVSKDYNNKLKQKFRAVFNDIKEINLNARFTEMLLQQKFRNLLLMMLDLNSFHFIILDLEKKRGKAINSKILYFYDLQLSNPQLIFEVDFLQEEIDSNKLRQRNNKVISQILGKKPKLDQNPYIVVEIVNQFRKQKIILIFQLDDYKWKGEGLDFFINANNLFIGLTKKISEGIKNIYHHDLATEKMKVNKKNSSKCILDLLQFAILFEQIKFKKEIEGIVEKKKIHDKKSLDRETYLFKSAQNQILARVRNYKKDLCKQNIGLLDFDQYGSLTFIYTDRPQHPAMQYFLSFLNEKQQKILKVFENHKKILKYINLASNGIFNSKQIALDESLVLRFSQDGKGRLSSISVVLLFIQETQTQLLQKKTNKYLVDKIAIPIKNMNGPGWMRNFLNNENKICSDRSPKNSQIIPGKFIIRKKPDQFCQSNFKNVFPMELLKEEIQFESVNLNILEYDNKKLLVFTLKLFSKLSYFRELPHENDQFTSFLKELSEEYQKNNTKFHNFSHGINVMHTTYIFCQSARNIDYLNDAEKFITIFSALCHDVGHTGFTNSFEINRQSDMALLYNYQSPLQNFHASKTFEILRKPKNNFLSSLSTEAFKKLRRMLISNILSTDIKEHFGMMKKFQSQNHTQSSQKIKIKRDNSLLTGMIVHASDFAGTVKKFDVCRAWSERVNAEFEKQYREQSRLKIPKTAFMKDLSNIAVLAKNEVGFLKVIVQPLFKCLSKFYQSDELISEMYRNSKENEKKWEKIVKQSIKENIKQPNEPSKHALKPIKANQNKINLNEIKQNE